MISLSIAALLLVYTASAELGVPLSTSGPTRPPIENNWITAQVRAALSLIETTIPTGNYTAIISKYYKPGFSYNITGKTVITDANDGNSHNLLTDFENVYQGAVSIKHNVINLWHIQPTYKAHEAGVFTVTYLDGSQMNVDYVRQWFIVNLFGVKTSVEYETVTRHWNLSSRVQ